MLRSALRHCQAFIGLVILLVCLCTLTGFQSNIGPVTFSSTLFTNVTTAQASAPVRNLGLASHWLTYCVNGTISNFQIELEASQDGGTTWFAISALGQSTNGCNTISAGGYWPAVRANIISITTVSGSITAYYNGSSYVIGTGGVSQGTITSQPVTFVPTDGFATTAVTQNGACIPNVGEGTIVFSGTFENTSAAKVYLLLADTNLQPWFGLGGTGPQYLQAVAPNSSVTLALPSVGLLAPTQMCYFASTSAINPVAPASPGVLSLQYRQGVKVNTKVNTLGTVTSTGSRNPQN